MTRKTSIVIVVAWLAVALSFVARPASGATATNTPVGDPTWTSIPITTATSATNTPLPITSSVFFGPRVWLPMVTR